MATARSGHTMRGPGLVRDVRGYAGVILCQSHGAGNPCGTDVLGSGPILLPRGERFGLIR